MPNIFISYVREDMINVRELVEELRRYPDVKVWFDLNVVEIGDEFMKDVENAINFADYFLPCFSDQFVKKALETSNFYMLEELRIAEKVWMKKTNRQKWALPIRLDDCILPEINEVRWLKGINYADVFIDKETKILKLATTILELEKELTPQYLTEFPSQSPYSEYDTSMNDLERLLSEFLYYHPDGYARAVNLYGADTDFVTEDRFVARYQRDYKYEVPLDLREEGLAHIENQMATGQRVFNGPTARLISVKQDNLDGDLVALEKTKLKIELGPISWFDYLMTNDVVRDDFQKAIKYLKPYDLLQGDISKIELSNIAETNIVIVSNDGYVGYQLRQTQAVGAGLYGSAIAENVNRFLDEVDQDELIEAINESNGITSFHSYVLSNIAANTLNSYSGDDVKAGSNYELKKHNIPHPFITVRRGIAEELSPGLLNFIKPFAIKLLGVSFDLMVFHPNYLFSVFVDLSANEIVDHVLQNPGRDFREGRVRFTKADYNDQNTKEIFQRRNWAPAGKAALIRSINFINTIKKSYNKKFQDIFPILEDLN